jgi:hypothetical protein
LYLWQIRQFPTEPQDRPVRNLRRIFSALAILAMLPLVIAAANDDGPEKSADSAASASNAAREFFQEALGRLKSRRSVQAQLSEQVSINDQPLRLTGKYASEGNKVRLELSVNLGGDAKGTLLEVSDGDILWNETIIAESRQVTLRNLKQIAAALAKQPPETASRLELGFGGLTGLMSSLDRTMEFDQLRESTEGDRRFVVVQGNWKAEFAESLKTNKEQPLPSYVPDSVRIYFDPETRFPHRFVYLKRHEEQKTLGPLVRLEFQDVKLDAPVDEAAFQFEQPTDIVPEDITQQYIDQLTRKPAKPDESAAPAEAKQK